MSREKQIEEMAKLISVARGYGCTEQDHCDMSCQVCKVGCIPHEDAQILYGEGYRKQEWISVDERLPEDTIPDNYKHKTIKVLVAIKGKNGFTIRTQQRFLDYTYRDGKRKEFWTWRFSGGDVTHWMPLPEPPKEGGAE